MPDKEFAGGAVQPPPPWTDNFASPMGELVSGSGLVRCGVDLIEIDRIAAAVERWGQRILNRVWTERELAYCRGRAPQLASRFAGKEAVSKTLGTGIRDIIWREIEILPDRRGKPMLFLHGNARERAKKLNLLAWDVSLTHSRNMASAVVVALVEK